MISTLTEKVAKSQGYTASEMAAGKEFYARKNRFDNPPGDFDRAGRFTAAERTEAVMTARTPSRAWPYSEMAAARTAAHCAELFDVEALAVKRIAKVLELENALSATCSKHEFLAAHRAATKALKPMKRLADAA